LKEKADLVIENNDTLEALQMRVDEAVKRIF